MKRKNLSIFAILVTILACTFVFAGCSKGVVPAYVYFKSDTGYVQYSNDLNAEIGNHIYLYENEEDSNDTDNSILSIKFVSGIINVERVNIDGNDEKSTVVNLSERIDIVITIKNTYYSNTKNIYINGEMVESNILEASVVSTTIGLQNVRLNSANLNDGDPIINSIEYK